MELNEAIERLKRILLQRDELNKIEDKEEREIEKSAYFEEMPFDEIDTVLKELNNRIPKKDIQEILEHQYELWNTPNKQKDYNLELVETLENLLDKE